YVQVDGGNWAIYAGPITLTEGNHVLHYYAADVAGLMEATHPLSVSVDVTPPATASSSAGTAGAIGWYSSNVTVSLTATDATSGWYVTGVSAMLTATDVTCVVATIEYRMDGGPWVTYDRAVTLGEGRHVLGFRATDLAGNREIDRSVGVLVDTTTPVSSAVLQGSIGDNGWYRSNVTVSLNASDATSGTGQLSYPLDNGSWLVYQVAFVLTNGEYVL